MPLLLLHLFLLMSLLVYHELNPIPSLFLTFECGLQIDYFPNATVAEYGVIQDGDVNAIKAEIFARGRTFLVLDYCFDPPSLLRKEKHGFFIILKIVSFKKDLHPRFVA